MMFKKGGFEVTPVVYPVAIKVRLVLLSVFFQYCQPLTLYATVSHTFGLFLFDTYDIIMCL